LTAASELVDGLVSVHDVPVLKQRYLGSQATRRVEFYEPWAEAIQRVPAAAPCAAGAIARCLVYIEPA